MRHRRVRYISTSIWEKKSWRYKVTTGESPGRHKPAPGVFARALVCSHVTGVSLSSFDVQRSMRSLYFARFKSQCFVQSFEKKCHWFGREKHFDSQTTIISFKRVDNRQRFAFQSSRRKRSLARPEVENISSLKKSSGDFFMAFKLFSQFNKLLE